MSNYLCPAIMFLPYLLYMTVFAKLFSSFRVFEVKDISFAYPMKYTIVPIMCVEHSRWGSVNEEE